MAPIEYSYRSQVTTTEFSSVPHLSYIRETNRASDWLARRDNRGVRGFTYFCMPLEYELSEIVREDKEGKLYFRYK